MIKNKIIGLLLVVLAVATIVGMVIENATFWLIYNYITIVLSGIIGVSLLYQR